MYWRMKVAFVNYEHDKVVVYSMALSTRSTEDNCCCAKSMLSVLPV